MNKHPGEEFSVDEIIAEFKETKLQTPPERQWDAPVFGAPIEPLPPAKEELALGESKVIEMPLQVEKKKAPPAPQAKEAPPRAKAAEKEAKPQPPAKGIEPEGKREAPRPTAAKEPPKGEKLPQEPVKKPRPLPEEEAEAPARERRKKQPPPQEPAHDQEKSRVRRFPLGKPQEDPPEIPGYPAMDYEHFEYEQEPEGVPHDFLFEPDPVDMPRNIANLGKKLRRLRGRQGVSLLLLFLGALVALVPMLPLALPEQLTFAQAPRLYYAMQSLLLGLSLLAASDVLIAGIYRLFRLRPTSDSLVVVCSLFVLAHCLWALTGKESGATYGCIAQLTLFFALLGKSGRLLMLRRAYKGAILSATPTSVCTKEDENQRTMAYKSQTAAPPELDTLADPDGAMKFGRIYSPLALVATVALAVMASVGTGNPQRLLQCLAAIGAIAAPLGLLTATTSPGVRITKKLFTSGTALLGHGATRELAWAELAVLGDGDLFPQGTVAISGMKIAKNQSMEKVVASAAGALNLIGGGLGHAFTDFAKQQYIFVPTPASVEYYDTGGLKAQIGQDTILCGTASFLMRMGIHVSEGRTIKSGVFVAINSFFAGVFALKYSGQPQSYSAFRVLRLGGLRPLLATRDFNLTPPMVEEKFDLKPGRSTYPDIGRRVALATQEDGGVTKPLALLSRNTMLSFCECAAGAHRLCRAERFNLWCGGIAGALGMGLMYYLSSTNNLAAGGPGNLLLYLVLWYIPVWLQSLLSSRY